MKKAVFNIGRAGCLSCKMAIEHAGRHIDGIKQIEVDIATHRIRVEYDEAKPHSLNDLIKIVGRIGYEARLIEDKNFGGA